MAAEKPEQDGFLVVIERKIAALKALADSYRAALSLGALGQPGEVDLSAVGSSSHSGGPIELPRGALLGKSLPAAVKLWLTAIRRKQTVREIAAALRAGGVESTSPNFENVVNGALYRLKANHEVLRFKDGWAAAELYPQALRSSITKSGRKPRKALSRHRKAGKKRVGKDNKSETILMTLSTDPAEAYSAGEISTVLNENGMVCTPDYVRVVMRRLHGRGKVEKRDGKYFRLTGRSNAA